MQFSKKKTIDMGECNMQKYVADNDVFFEFLTKHTYPEEGSDITNNCSQFSVGLF